MGWWASTPAPFPDEVRAMGLSDAEADAYWRLTEDLEREGARVPAEVADAPGTARYPPVHRLGGAPHEIQNPMEAECELVRRGEDPHALPYSRQEEVAGEAKARWRLLLQVDSDETAGLMWGPPACSTTGSGTTTWRRGASIGRGA
jgi:hypothetical protein